MTAVHVKNTTSILLKLQAKNGSHYQCLLMDTAKAATINGVSSSDHQ